MATYSELLIEQGATFATTVTVYDSTGSAFDLSGYTPRAQLRKSYYSANASNISVNVTDAANGVISLSMTSANTSILSAGRYVYDLIMDNATVRVRVVEGIATVFPSVTR